MSTTKHGKHRCGLIYKHNVNCHSILECILCKRVASLPVNEMPFVFTAPSMSLKMKGTISLEEQLPTTEEVVKPKLQFHGQL